MVYDFKTTELYCDRRLGGAERWIQGNPNEARMRVPNEIKDGAYFLCVEVGSELGEYFHFIGTCFFIQVDTQYQKHSYLVTARHVIEEAWAIGHKDIYLRINRRDGGSRPVRLRNQWVFPRNPAIDVCVLPFPTPFEFLVDVWFRPIPAGDMLLTQEVIDDQSVGVGDELVISGLFSKRGGEAKNLPILRSGIIAAMPEEPFEEVINGKRHKFDAYLVEARSIGGLSGSPVFLVIEPWRVPIAHIPNLKELQWHFYLLGLVRGRWDLKKQEEAQNPGQYRRREPRTEEESEMERLNTGIAQVTPISEAMALINGDKLKKQRQRADNQKVKQNAAIKD
jgi:hypothetical protein